MLSMELDCIIDTITCVLNSVWWSRLHLLLLFSQVHKIHGVNEKFQNVMAKSSQMSTPDPLKLFLSLFLSASYRQNGSSMVVHSFMNSMEPPGSAEMSQMARSRWGSEGAPIDREGLFRFHCYFDTVVHHAKRRIKYHSTNRSFISHGRDRQRPLV